jgi:hypothetical protein
MPVLAERFQATAGSWTRPIRESAASSSQPATERKPEAAPRALIDGVAIAGSAIVPVGVNGRCRQLPAIAGNSTKLTQCACSLAKRG